MAASLERAQEQEELRVATQISDLGNRILHTPLTPPANPYHWCKDYLQGIVDCLGADGAHMRLLEPEPQGEIYRLAAAVGDLAELRWLTRPVTRRGGSCNLKLLRAGGWITHTQDQTRKLNRDVTSIENAHQHGNAFKDLLDRIESTAMLPLAAKPPLTGRPKVLGSFVIDSNQPFFFTERRARLARTAAALGGAILHAKREAVALAKKIAAADRLRRGIERAQEAAHRERAVRDAFEDVAHQIKSPLAEALRRVEQSAGRYQDSPAHTDFKAIQTLLHRAQLSSKLIGLFARLAQGLPLDCNTTRLTPHDLASLVQTVCDDNRPRISHTRQIRIIPDADSLSQRTPPTLLADPQLIWQALNNLVDNAVKYSYSNTTIRVSVGTTQSAEFYISVTNQGFPINSDQVGLVAKRFWRGDQAKGAAAEGTGLGLWIVDQIMKVHLGKLEVFPTRPADHVTEFRLTFPPAT